MSSSLKPETRRWFIIAVIFIAIVFNYFDRQIVSILKPTLKDVYKIDDRGYAYIINIFTFCYAIMYPVSGWLVDKYGAKKVMFFGVIGWSLASLGGGLARSLGQFSFFRGMLGVAEPTNFPAQLRVVTVWFPGKLRATANSLCVAGSSIGAIISVPLVTWLELSFGWQMVFLVAGTMGLVIALLWILIYRDPPAHILQEATENDTAIEKPGFKWSQLWATKSLWGILLIRFVTDPVWYFCLMWLPGYLRESSGLSKIEVGKYGWIPFLVADLGAIGTAAWSDYLVRKGRKPLNARKIMLSCVACLSPLCVLTPFLPSAFSTIAIFSVVAIACLSWLFTISVVVAESFPSKNVASVLGIAGGCGALGAVIFNYYVGQMMGTVGAGKIFIVMAFLHPIGVLILWTMIKPEKPKLESQLTISS
jgi:ACS family hexuronate transporter-like MFS transporter